MLGQREAAFSGDGRDLSENIATFFKSDTRPGVAETVEAFIKHLTDGEFTAVEEDTIAVILSQLEAKRARSSPDVSEFLETLNAIADNKTGSVISQGYLNLATKYSQGELRQFKKYNDAMLLLLRESVLSRTTTRDWRIVQDEYKIVEENGQPAVVFSGAQLGLYTGSDTILIDDADGTYYPYDAKWIGTKGTVLWTKAGFTPEEAYATLGNYTINLNSASYDADSVLFYFPRIGEKSYQGKLSDKASIGSGSGLRGYPQFTSYEAVLELNNLFENIDYSGGFTIQGSEILGTGTDSLRAQVTIKQNDTIRMRVASQSFSIQPDRIAALEAAISIYLESDSVFHNQQIFSYIDNSKTVTLSKERTGLSQSPYSDTYHYLEFTIDNVVWNINTDSMLFKSIANPQRVMPVSSQFLFTENEYAIIRGALGYNPLQRIYNYVTPPSPVTFHIDDLARYFNNTPENIQNLLLLLAVKGYLYYDPSSGIITVKNKLKHYVLSHLKVTDYDNIQFESQVEDRTIPNASLHLSDSRMDFFGVETVVISDSQATYIYPKDGELSVNKSLGLNFDGQVHSGRFDYWGDSFQFNYQKNYIELDDLDSVKFKYPDYDEKGNYIGLRQIQTAIENVTGILYVDAPDNKSGLKPIDSFPIFDCFKKSFVFYDRAYIYDSVYDRERFFYTIDPFRVVNLDKFTADGLQFPGELTAADITPKIRNALTIQEDFSLGFIQPSPTSGYAMYKGKGTGRGTFYLSNRGYIADGAISYLAADSRSANHILFPDSMESFTSEFDLNRTAGSSYPPAFGEDVTTHWVPYMDSMYVFKKEKPIKVYDGRIDFAGDLVLTPKELVGRGTVNYQNLSMSSQSFAFLPNNVKSKESQLKINNIVGGGSALVASDVEANIDLNTEVGQFLTNEDTTRIYLPSNAFATTLQKFTYDFKSSQVDFNKGENQYEEDAVFISEAKEGEDPLVFESSKAVFTLEDQNILAQNVPFLLVADAKIVLPNNELNIKKGGDIGTVQGAEIYASAENENHRIYNALVNIFGKDKFTGFGYYNYLGSNVDSTQIYFNDIRVDAEGHTLAKATINDTALFMIGPGFQFRGLATLRSQAYELYFAGGVKPAHNLKGLGTEWIAVNDSFGENRIVLNLNEAKNEQGQELTTAVYYDEAGTEIDRVFLGKPAKESNHIVTSATGYLFFDDLDSVYHLGPKEYIDFIRDGYQPDFTAKGYRLARVIPKTNNFELWGPFDFSTSFKHIDYQMAGKYIYNTRYLTDLFTTSMMINIPISEEAALVMADSFVDNAYQAEASIGEGGWIENAFALMIEKKSDREAVVGEFNSSGFIPSVDATRKTFIITKAEFRYNEAYNALLSDGPIHVANVASTPVDKQIGGGIMIQNKEKNEDRFTMLFQSSPGGFHYFSYNTGAMYYLSSDYDFNDIMESNREQLLKDTKGYEQNQANKNEWSAFKFDILKL